MRIAILLVLIVLFALVPACDEADWGVVYKEMCKNPEGWRMKLFCMVYIPDEGPSTGGSSTGTADDRCKQMQNSHFDADKNDCVCDTDFTEEYFTQYGKVCLNTALRNRCQSISHAYIDPVSRDCACDDGYKPGGATDAYAYGAGSLKECVPIAAKIEPADCKAETSTLNQIVGMMSAAKQEVVDMDRIADRIERYRFVSQVGEESDLLQRTNEPGYNPGLPPYPNLPSQGYDRLLGHYKPDRDFLWNLIADALNPKLAGARAEIKNGNCAAAAILLDQYNEDFGYAYWRFTASSCAMRAKTRIQKDAALIVSTFVELPAGCNCNDLQFTIMNREFNNAAVLGMMISQKPLRTIPACQAVAGELIQVDNLPSKVVINNYYGKRGLFWIYYETSWLYGLLEPRA